MIELDSGVAILQILKESCKTTSEDTCTVVIKPKKSRDVMKMSRDVS